MLVCYATIWEQFGVQHLAQGHFNMWPGGAGGGTTNRLMDDLLSLLEPQPPSNQLLGLALIIYHLQND